MFKVSLNILFVCIAVAGFAQKNPHGFEKGTDCRTCHSTEDWSFVSTSFNHDSTGFVLTGQHRFARCTDCHTSLAFSEAQSSCVSCHTDLHAGTVGLDCNRCHETNSWLVQNTLELHEQSRFPLLGAHKVVDCADCHTAASHLQFEPLGSECIDCHQKDYQATTNPNHVQTGFSTNCIDCHRIDAFEWSASGINHAFFPLTKGHALNDCAACHTNNLTEPLSTDCFSCHLSDYTLTTNPSHQSLDFDYDCTQCHTTDPDWKPAEFRDHDPFFPIYSGEHKGEWNHCTDCHTQPENYALFSCIDCHEHNRSETDNEHQGISGYTYASTSCFACHPTGDAESGFDHNATAFPLTGSHTSADCNACHTSGFASTSTLCSSCHLTEYYATLNPNHASIGLSNNCDDCHETGPGWDPASFPNHNEYHALNGAHAVVSADCYLCHQGDYNNTPNSCFGCHSADYNSTNDPNHVTAQFSTDCETCHSESAWTPSTFDHDNQYFPIYSGAHREKWNNCTECHTEPSSYAMFSCTVCHEHNQTEMNTKHNEVAGYIYDSVNCFNCHPTGKNTN
ncbi:hypothetical protein [Saccharicrinis sp. 156]|uniref:hypothetical protein n=1 Tax=Saccharicrinis sp. 156 TaxID=3417574 RepID=UPI003D339096